MVVSVIGCWLVAGWKIFLKEDENAYLTLPLISMSKISITKTIIK